MELIKNLFLAVILSCSLDAWACQQDTSSLFRNETNKDLYIHEIQYHNRFSPVKWTNSPKISPGQSLKIPLCSAQIKKIYYTEADSSGKHGKMNLLEGRFSVGSSFNALPSENGSTQLFVVPQGLPYSIKVQNRTNKYVQIFIEYDVIPVKFLREICGKNDLFQLVPQGAKSHQIKNSLGEVTKTVKDENTVSVGACNVKSVRAEIFDGPEWSNKIATVTGGGTLSSSATYQVIFNSASGKYEVKR